jgi:aspartate aminotransferase
VKGEKMKLSSRAINVQASPIRRLTPLLLEAKKRGIVVHHLNIGQPDIETPKPFWDAVKSYDEKVLAYGLSDGFPELKDAVAAYFGRFGVSLSQSDIQVTTAGSEAILYSLCLVSDPSDEVLVFEPFYTNYNGFGTIAGINVVPVTTKAEDGFAIPSFEEIEKKVTAKTKAIIICSPNNPTGHILTPEELERIVAVAKKHNLFIISDEVYREFTYEGAKATSIFEIKGADERCIVCDSISKRFSACGARVGFLICKNKKVMESALKFAQARLCPPTLEQVGAIAAYRMDPSYFDPIRVEYQKRRDTLLEVLNSNKEIVVKKPQGAFYIMAKLPVRDSDDFASFLLTDFNVDGETTMVAPGDGFYATEGLGRNEVRLAYVLNVEKTKRAGEILLKGLDAYKNR